MLRKAFLIVRNVSSVSMQWSQVSRIAHCQFNCHCHGHGKISEFGQNLRILPVVSILFFSRKIPYTDCHRMVDHNVHSKLFSPLQVLHWLVSRPELHWRRELEQIVMSSLPWETEALLSPAKQGFLTARVTTGNKTKSKTSGRRTSTRSFGLADISTPSQESFSSKCRAAIPGNWPK